MTRALFASVLTGMGASLCCYGPAILMALGGGAWALYLPTVSPYRPLLVGGTLLCLGFALNRLYLLPAYAANWSRAQQCALARQRRWFWWTATLVLGLLAAPWLAPLFG
ncbi:mercuric transporter MerT family protein [Pseudomonas sp. MOB-449]|nr:mercuric transporter MerT family protein [Pseudomonas sp. MOB-449]